MYYKQNAVKRRRSSYGTPRDRICGECENCGFKTSCVAILLKRYQDDIIPTSRVKFK